MNINGTRKTAKAERFIDTGTISMRPSKTRRFMMKKIIIVCLMLAAVAYASQRTVVVEEFTATQ